MSVLIYPQVAVIARYTALEAIRTRYIWLLGAVLLAGGGAGLFAGDIAITETHATQAAIAASLLRFAAVMLVILFVTTSVHRDFNDKSVELMLSLPLPRGGYYLGKLAGYAAVAVVTAAPLCLLLMLFAPAAAAVSWGLSLLLELVLVASLSLLFAFAFSQATASIFASLMFYLLSRSITAMQLMAHSPLTNQEQLSAKLMVGLVDGLAYLLPDLDTYARSAMLIYPGDAAGTLGVMAVQTLIYVLLLSGVAMFDLYRKNF